MAAYPWRYSSSRDVPAPSPLSRDPKIASPTADDGKAVPRMLRNDLITLLGQGSNDPVTVDVGGIFVDAVGVTWERGTPTIVLDPDELTSALEGIIRKMVDEGS